MLALVAGPAFTRFRVLSAYTYVWIVVAIVLFVALALFGQEVNGAKLWIRVGGVQFEPVEVIKLLVVLFMASYLAATGDVIARTRPWSLRANAKYLGPLFIGWGVSMAILVLRTRSRDGDCCCSRRSRRCSTSRRGASTLIVGVHGDLRAARSGGRRRTSTTCERASRSGTIRSAIPTAPGIKRCSRCSRSPPGGFFGTGYHAGRPDFIPDVATDYVYAAVHRGVGRARRDRAVRARFSR